MVKFPSIEQYRNFIQSIKRQLTYAGKDPNGEPIYRNVVLPKLTLEGTVKLHGTNAGITLELSTGNIYAQSRERVLTVQEDNCGFASFVEANKEHFINLFMKLVLMNGNQFNGKITIFGEWVGKSIQKGVGISNIEKSFFMFDACNTDNQATHWLSIKKLKAIEDARIFNINDYQTYSIELDLDNPTAIQNDLGKLTLEVEEQCPVAKAFGIDGIGEGIVWSVILDGIKHRFKVKGEKHSVSKVTKLANVDVEKLNGINAFVDYAVTENRLRQGLQTVFGESEIDIKRIGDFIKWVSTDVWKEESDTLQQNGMTMKDISSRLSSKARQFFIDELNKQI